MHGPVRAWRSPFSAEACGSPGIAVFVHFAPLIEFEMWCDEGIVEMPELHG
jgi:hypothetical protein